MADWINAQVPHWLEARVQQRDPTQAVMAAMQFGANQRQHNFENGLRLRQLDMQDQAQQLQNRSTGLRIEQMQRDLDNENHDIGLMEGYLSSINGVTDIDQLREVGAKIPAFKNPLNVTRAIGAASNRLNMLSGTLAQKQAADDRAYFTKEMDALDPDLRALARTTLGDSGMPEDADSIGILKYVKEEQVARRQEQLLTLKEAESKIIEGRQLAVEKVRNLYRAGMRGSISIMDKAKLIAYQSELRAATYDPMLSTEEKEIKQHALFQKYGVTPNFTDGEGAALPEITPEIEASLYDSEITKIQQEIDQEKIDLARNPGRYFGRKDRMVFPDIGTDERTLKIQALEGQKTRLEALKKTQLTTSKTLSADLARDFLQKANGDKDKARALAREAGYEF